MLKTVAIRTTKHGLMVAVGRTAITPNVVQSLMMLLSPKPLPRPRLRAASVFVSERRLARAYAWVRTRAQPAARIRCLRRVAPSGPWVPCDTDRTRVELSFSSTLLEADVDQRPDPGGHVSSCPRVLRGAISCDSTQNFAGNVQSGIFTSHTFKQVFSATVLRRRLETSDFQTSPSFTAVAARNQL
jgi:hypothetical protein